jgi:hypothetical protein
MTPRLLAAALLAVLSLGPATADTEAPVPPIKEDFVNLLRVDLRAAKAEIVTNSLELTSEELARFWPIYHEYDLTLAKLNTDRVAMLREFSLNYASIGDELADELTHRSLEFQHKRLALLEKYYERVAKAFNPATAARFVQIEHQLLLLVDVQIASELPLIPRKAFIERLEKK